MKNDPQYPHGKISKDDEGELDIAIAADKDQGVVRIHFRKPVLWLGLEKLEALGLADLIRRKAEELP